ncbi:MAG: hypothetical protein IPF99_27625 [Deltaproteobacteria bacterium]|nr:hypothetical protein [Deltaproteobacteria bacterium]
MIATADHGGHGLRHGTHAQEDLHIPWVAGLAGDPRRLLRPGAHHRHRRHGLAALGVAVPASFTGRLVQRVLAPP